MGAAQGKRKEDDMSEKFTPGPWVADFDTELETPYWLVAEVNGIEIVAATDGDEAADARLIAATPDLYGALEKAVEYNSETYEPDEPWWMSEAKAALAKARGDHE